MMLCPSCKEYEVVYTTEDGMDHAMPDTGQLPITVYLFRSMRCTNPHVGACVILVSREHASQPGIATPLWFDRTTEVLRLLSDK